MTMWQVQAAKQRFSEVVRAAESGEAQFITRHGETVAVIIDIADYRRTHVERAPVNEFLMSVPRGGDIPLPSRTVDADRVDGLVQAWQETAE